MTTLQLSIMMAAYVGNNDFDNFNRTTKTYIQQRDVLINTGMIEARVIGDSHKIYPFELTEKGKMWYEHILNVPFPKQKTIYVME